MNICQEVESFIKRIRETEKQSVEDVKDSIAEAVGKIRDFPGGWFISEWDTMKGMEKMINKDLQELRFQIEKDAEGRYWGRVVWRSGVVRFDLQDNLQSILRSCRNDL